MNINAFARLVAKNERGRKEVNIAQIKEILKVVNALLDGHPYRIIRWGWKTAKLYKRPVGKR